MTGKPGPKTGKKPTRKPAVKGGLPDRQAILDFLADAPKKAGKREIARAFNIKGNDRITLKKMLRDMTDEGLIAGRRKSLRRPGDLPPVTVLRIEGIDDQGDPIAVPTEWDESEGPAPRFCVPHRASGRRRGTAPPPPAPGIGDRILARLVADDASDGLIAKVIKILPRKPAAALGIYRKVGTEHRVVPVSRKGSEFQIPAAELADARDGELVAIEPLDGERGRRDGRGSRNRNDRFGLPMARIVRRIGDVSSESAVSLIALEEHGIPHIFPDPVVDEAETASEFDRKSYEDWRDRPLITIDPADARDHDDAVLAEPDPAIKGGHILTIAIADVAAYVRPGAPMDAEARRRGNSVYFPGRVVPMLPERISNDLCSLREGEDRPALAVRIHIGPDGSKAKHSFHRVVMKSAAGLSYQQAQSAIDGNPDDQAAPLMDRVLTPLWAAYKTMAAARDARAPLNIDLPERKLDLDDAGKVTRIFTPPRLAAHRLIEEFMIAANVCAAEALESKRATVVYRVHDEPALEKLAALRDFLASLDMNFPKSGNIRPAAFNGILKHVAGTEHETLVNEVVLRCQSQAIYTTENIGHFGLNLRRYAHFTSPIRRYADLLVHRALVTAFGLGPGGQPRDDATDLETIAGEISTAERRAMAAERDTKDRLIASWLADRVGAQFTGNIRGVTRAGLFVELDETGADGFVPISTIGDDYYLYEEDRHRVIGRNTGEVFALGDAVEVRLVEALPFAGALRFEILSDGTIDKKAPPARAKVKTRKSRRTAKASKKAARQVKGR
ncbi:MAG: ribonuclease R [Alphaproteobacteria bacterium]